MSDRDWTLANAKRGPCRVCPPGLMKINIELAHVIRREVDQNDPVGNRRQRKPWIVLPSRVVPLCRSHHRAYDDRRLDLLGYLTPEEEAQAVFDAKGLENARMRICPSAYRRTNP